MYNTEQSEASRDVQTTNQRIQRMQAAEQYHKAPALSVLTADHLKLRSSVQSKKLREVGNGSVQEYESVKGNESLVALLDVHDKDSFCCSWDINVDEWWTHHVDYAVVSENATHQCFERRTDSYELTILTEAYNTMWRNANCSEAFVWHMFNSGWGADLGHVAEGIVCAVGDQKPFAVAFRGPKQWWHYAALKQNGTSATCSARDMSCYFLPMGKCVGHESQVMKYKTVTRYSDYKDYRTREALLVNKYITRLQQWMRKAVHDYNFEKAPKLNPDENCTVMHVRRGDVVLHTLNSRRYFPISEYMDKLPPERKAKGATILLLTDDANAIDEAKEFFPEVNWAYYDRERFRGTSGGWENTAPSKSPKTEVIVILSTLKLVKQCDALVFGTSGFASAIKREMQATAKQISVYQVDAKQEIRHSKNVDSHLKLEKHLDELRAKRHSAPSRAV